MFEVSWCVGLYVTILALEFLPVPLEHFGLTRALAAWRRWSGAYVALAMTLFVYMLSRNPLYAAITAVIFGVVAWVFRERDQPIPPRHRRGDALHHAPELARLAVSPDAEHARRAVVVAGDAHRLLPLLHRGRDRAGGPDRDVDRPCRDRPFPQRQLAAVGQVTFWALLVYLAFRFGDLALRGQLAGAFSGRLGLAFAAEIVLGGVVPAGPALAGALRARPGLLLLASALAVLGVVYNRINVVLFAMDLRGRMPWVAAERYAPSFVEWAVSIGLIAATVFLFGLGARWVPVLPKREAGQGH